MPIRSSSLLHPRCRGRPDREAVLQELAVALPDLERPYAGHHLPGLIEAVAAPLHAADRGGEVDHGLAIGVVVGRIVDAGRGNLPHRAQGCLAATRLAGGAEAHAEADADAR